MCVACQHGFLMYIRGGECIHISTRRMIVIRVRVLIGGITFLAVLEADQKVSKISQSRHSSSNLMHITN